MYSYDNTSQNKRQYWRADRDIQQEKESLHTTDKISEIELNTVQLIFKKTNGWECENTKGRFTSLIKRMKNNLKHEIKSTLFLQPTNTKAKRGISNVCYFLMTEGLEKEKKKNSPPDENNLRYRDCWNKS